MKKYFAFLVLGVYATVAFAAVTSEQRIKTDKVVVGRPAPATDPAIEFQGTTQRIKANRTTGRMQFTNDGTNFKNIGSGSGGAGGVNLLVDDNGDFEAGDTAWTESGGTFSIETTNPLFGVGSGKWDSSASAQTLISNLKTIEKGMVGRVCGAGLVYKWPSGVAADLSFQVLDASSTVIFSNDLSPTSGDDIFKSQRNFDCGALGSQYRVRILSNVSNPAEIIIDNVFLGSDNNSFHISQATAVASGYFATTASCTWTRTNTALGSMTDADCPGPTVEFNQGPGTLQATDFDSPKFQINNLPPGRYEVGFLSHAINSGAAFSALAITDGTTTSGQSGAGWSTTATQFHAVGNFAYTSSGNRTFELQVSSAAGAVTIDNNAGNQRLYFYIKRYPTSSAEALTLETTGSSWSGYHDATCTTWSRTNTAYGAFAADASCALVERVNNGFGTVSTSGSVLPAISFTPKLTGAYYVSVKVNDLDCGTTGANYSVRLTDGTSVIATGSGDCASGGVEGVHLNLSGIYNISSITPRTLSLEAKSSAGTLTLSKNGADAAIEWSIYPISQQMPAPVFTELQNNMKAGGNGYRTLTAFIDNSGTPTVSREDGDWISSLTDNGVGDVTINFTGGTFSATPNCFLLCYATAGAGCSITAQNTTPATNSLLRTIAFSTTTASAIDRPFYISCTGPQ